jgi:DNA-binding transcriptional ArsR family regulator
MLDAADDPLLVQRGSVAALYLHLVKRLDFMEFRRLRASRVATDMGVRAETIGTALKMLREAGYIERGPRVIDVFTYRLIYSRRREVPPKP